MCLDVSMNRPCLGMTAKRIDVKTCNVTKEKQQEHSCISDAGKE